MHLLLPDWIGLGGKIKLEIRNLLKACLETEHKPFSTFLRGFGRFQWIFQESDLTKGRPTEITEYVLTFSSRLQATFLPFFLPFAWQNGATQSQNGIEEIQGPHLK